MKCEERRKHPNCLWALWFDRDGNGPIDDWGQNNGGCDIQVEWTASDHEAIPPRVTIAGSVLGGLYVTPDTAREIARRLLKAADEVEVYTGDTKVEIVWGDRLV